MTLEKVLRGQIALAMARAGTISLLSPLDVLAKGPEDANARQLQIHAAKLKIFLDVLTELSKPETKFEFAKFDVE